MHASLAHGSSGKAHATVCMGRLRISGMNVGVAHHAAAMLVPLTVTVTSAGSADRCLIIGYRQACNIVITGLGTAGNGKRDIF